MKVEVRKIGNSLGVILPRLRESMPFVGLLPQSVVRRLHEEASA